VSDWNDKIIVEFRANGGKVGGPFEGATLLLLHHVGEGGPRDPGLRTPASGVGGRVRSGARVHPTGPIVLGPVHSPNGRACRHLRLGPAGV